MTSNSLRSKYMIKRFKWASQFQLTHYIDDTSKNEFPWKDQNQPSWINPLNFPNLRHMWIFKNRSTGIYTFIKKKEKKTAGHLRDYAEVDQSYKLAPTGNEVEQSHS